MTQQLDLSPMPFPIKTMFREKAKLDAEALVQLGSENKERYFERSLANQIVQAYLAMIDVPTRVSVSADTPMLYVEELKGYISCYPVKPEAEKCSILEADQTSQASIFIEVSEPYYSARILGCVTEPITVSELPLSFLRPFDTFIDFLEDAQPVPVIQWLQDTIAGWLPRQEVAPAWVIERSLLQTREPRLGFREPTLRNADDKGQEDAALERALLQEADTDELVRILNTTNNQVARWLAAEKLYRLGGDHPQLPVIEVKRLASELNGLPLALEVGSLTRPDGKLLVCCRLYCLEGEHLLPQGLVLSGIEKIRDDNSGDETVRTPFFELKSTGNEKMLEHLFSVDVGDCVSLKVLFEASGSINTFVFSGTVL